MQSHLPRRCRAVRQSLSRLLDRDLSEAQRARLEAHLAACDGCRDAWEQLQALQNSVRTLAIPEESEAARYRVLHRVAAKAEAARTSPPPRVWRPLAAFSVVATIVTLSTLSMTPRSLSSHADLSLSHRQGVPLPAVAELGELFDLHDELSAQPEVLE